MIQQLLTVSLRQKAVFIPETASQPARQELSAVTAGLLANLLKLGYSVSEPLLQALLNTTPGFQASVLQALRDVTGVDKNWTPLVKGWDTPTGETGLDHTITLFANLFRTDGTTLACGHIIPRFTFPLYRYNGCPFCGAPFEFGQIEHYKRGSGQTVLELWTADDAAAFLADLLSSATALDATQMDSLKLLLDVFPLPDVRIRMKETLMAVIDMYFSQQQADKVQALLTSPTDILRYLWYKHTGHLQLIAPGTILQRQARNKRHWAPALVAGVETKVVTEDSLKLRYGRSEGRMVAQWLNNMQLDTAHMCETMHPKRGMWVRFIRALRLPEYSKLKGFEKLRELLDKFYNRDYEVWRGEVHHSRLRLDADKTFRLLQQRPGLFARSLFANMLWFGPDAAIAAFEKIIDQVPVRLVFTLSMYADNYFNPANYRSVKPLGGVTKAIAANRLLSLYDAKQLAAMTAAVENLCLLAVKKRWADRPATGKTMYIEPMLFKIPAPVGDRSETIQDLPGALMGTRFKAEGDTVRLFMQWGSGLPAQHLDMDLSCLITYETDTERCSYSNLVATGCKHSGDIRAIPEKTGTAEYIEIDLKALRSAGAKYVAFTCNAYSAGGITPNLVVGWMNSRYPMTISEKTGVAYDPSCVQHQVRIVNKLTKGMVFGVLDVKQQEIIWLEMAFDGQVVGNLDTRNIEAILRKLDSKISIGQLLTVKAEAQQLEIRPLPDADEVYTMEWAMNTAAVTKLLLD